MKVDGQILSENHLRDAKLKIVRFAGFPPLYGIRIIVRCLSAGLFLFDGTCGIWVVSRAQTRPFLGASFFMQKTRKEAAHDKYDTVFVGVIILKKDFRSQSTISENNIMFT